MATEPIDPALNTTSPEGEVKVVYTEAQQAHLQTLIDAAAARAGKAAREELAAEKTKAANLAAELAAAKAAKKVEPPPQTNEEIERVKAAHKTEVDAANKRAKLAAQEAATARTEAQNVRTEVAITNAASKVPFVDLSVVIKLTKDSVKLDPETGRFQILNDNGQPRLNASFEPMSLDEFYNDFAAKNKYLVRGTVAPGTGGSETSRTLSSNGRFEVTEIFGPKSDGAKASQLMKQDPAEYHRLKAVARSARLIA